MERAIAIAIVQVCEEGMLAHAPPMAGVKVMGKETAEGAATAAGEAAVWAAEEADEVRAAAAAAAVGMVRAGAAGAYGPASAHNQCSP